jgi:hypothetical protein
MVGVKKKRRKTDLYLKDNIMTSEYKSNDPKSIENSTNFAHVRVSGLRWAVRNPAGPTLGD